MVQVRLSTFLSLLQVKLDRNCPPTEPLVKCNVKREIAAFVKGQKSGIGTLFIINCQYCMYIHLERGTILWCVRNSKL